MTTSTQRLRKPSMEFMIEWNFWTKSDAFDDNLDNCENDRREINPPQRLHRTQLGTAVCRNRQPIEYNNAGLPA